MKYALGIITGFTTLMAVGGVIAVDLILEENKKLKKEKELWESAAILGSKVSKLKNELDKNQE